VDGKVSKETAKGNPAMICGGEWKRVYATNLILESDNSDNYGYV